jgi:hypothetical protein
MTNPPSEPAQPALEFAFRAVQEDNERLRRMLQATEDRVIYLSAMLYQEQSVVAGNESLRQTQIEALSAENQQLRDRLDEATRRAPAASPTDLPVNGVVAAAGSQG